MLTLQQQESLMIFTFWQVILREVLKHLIDVTSCTPASRRVPLAPVAAGYRIGAFKQKVVPWMAAAHPYL